RLARGIQALRMVLARWRAPPGPLPFSTREAGGPTFPRRATRRRLGTISRNSSSLLPARSICTFDKPVTLPPGRERLVTRPAATGSVPKATTIGMVDVACFTGAAALSAGTMTSTLRRTNSAATSAKRSGRPSAQRYLIVTVRPSIQPSSPKRRTKASVHGRQTDAAAAPRRPMVGTFPGCCAVAASGHAAAAPPSSVMTLRRFIQSPRRRGRATSDERCESLKINMFPMPCGLVAAWAAQHERFEGGHTAVWTRYVVVGDLDRGEVAALRPG